MTRGLFFGFVKFLDKSISLDLSDLSLSPSSAASAASAAPDSIASSLRLLSELAGEILAVDAAVASASTAGDINQSIIHLTGRISELQDYLSSEASATSRPFVLKYLELSTHAKQALLQFKDKAVAQKQTAPTFDVFTPTRHAVVSHLRSVESQCAPIASASASAASHSLIPPSIYKVRRPLFPPPPSSPLCQPLVESLLSLSLTLADNRRFAEAALACAIGSRAAAHHNGLERHAELFHKLFTSWFLGESCMFTNNKPSAEEGQLLIDVLKHLTQSSPTITNLSPTFWELSMYNLGVAYFELGFPSLSSEVYARILATPSPHSSRLAPPSSGRRPLLADTLVVATVASDVRPELSNLLFSASLINNATSAAQQKRQIAVDVLGLGRPYPGNAGKVLLYLDFVETLNPEQLVLCVDAYDILLFGGLWDSVDKFRNGTLGWRGAWGSTADDSPPSNSRPLVVFAGDMGSYPDRGISALYSWASTPPSPSSSSSSSSAAAAAAAATASQPLYRYLNSGTFLGRAGSVAAMLRAVVAYPALVLDDQRSFVRYYLTHRSEVLIDRVGNDILTLHGLEGASFVEVGKKGGDHRFYNYIEGEEDDKPERHREELSRRAGGVGVVHGNAGGLGGKQYYHEIAAAMRRTTTKERGVDASEGLREARDCNSGRIRTDLHVRPRTEEELSSPFASDAGPAAAAAAAAATTVWEVVRPQPYALGIAVALRGDYSLACRLFERHASDFGTMQERRERAESLDGGRPCTDFGEGGKANQGETEGRWIGEASEGGGSWVRGHHIDGYYNLAYSRLMMGKWQEALETYGTCLDFDPTYVLCGLNYAHIAVEKDEKKGVDMALRKLQVVREALGSARKDERVEGSIEAMLKWKRDHPQSSSGDAKL